MGTTNLLILYEGEGSFYLYSEFLRAMEVSNRCKFNLIFPELCQVFQETVTLDVKTTNFRPVPFYKT